MVTPYRIREEGLLTLRVEREGEALVIRARGEVDIASAAALEGELESAIGSGDVTQVVLDLGGLTFVDSTGLRALLAAGELARTKHRRIQIVHAPAVFRRLVGISGVERSLPPID